MTLTFVNRQKGGVGVLQFAFYYIKYAEMPTSKSNLRFGARTFGFPYGTNPPQRSLRYSPLHKNVCVIPVALDVYQNVRFDHWPQRFTVGVARYASRTPSQSR